MQFSLESFTKLERKLTIDGKINITKRFIREYMKTIGHFFEKFILIYIVLYIIPYGFEYIVELDLNPNTPSFWTSITVWFGETFFYGLVTLKSLVLCI